MESHNKVSNEEFATKMKENQRTIQVTIQIIKDTMAENQQNYYLRMQQKKLKGLASLSHRQKKTFKI